MAIWLRLYTEILNDPKIQKLEPSAFRNWINMLCLASQYDGNLPEIADISFALRLPGPECESILNELIQHGLLDQKRGVIRPHNWDSRQYKSDSSTERVKRFRNAKRNVSETEDETKHETGPETEQIQNRTEQKGKGTPTGYSPEFELFWEHYPKKAGKGAAWKAWKKIKPSEALQRQIRIAVELAIGSKDWIRDDGQFIPHPATWLNESRWDDKPGSAIAQTRRLAL